MSTESAALPATVTFHAATPSPVAVSGELWEAVRRLRLDKQFPRVIELTRELFGDDFTISVEEDAEIAHWFDVVFTVKIRGLFEEIMARDSQWHDRIPHDTTQASGAFCLALLFDT